MSDPCMFCEYAINEMDCCENKEKGNPPCLHVLFHEEYIASEAEIADLKAKIKKAREWIDTTGRSIAKLNDSASFTFSCNDSQNKIDAILAELDGTKGAGG